MTHSRVPILSTLHPPLPPPHHHNPYRTSLRPHLIPPRISLSVSSRRPISPRPILPHSSLLRPLAFQVPPSSVLPCSVPPHSDTNSPRTTYLRTISSVPHCSDTNDPCTTLQALFCAHSTLSLMLAFSVSLPSDFFYLATILLDTFLLSIFFFSASLFHSVFYIRQSYSPCWSCGSAFKTCS